MLSNFSARARSRLKYALWVWSFHAKVCSDGRNVLMATVQNYVCGMSSARFLRIVFGFCSAVCYYCALFSMVWWMMIITTTLAVVFRCIRTTTKLWRLKTVSHLAFCLSEFPPAISGTTERFRVETARYWTAMYLFCSEIAQFANRMVQFNMIKPN